MGLLVHTEFETKEGLPVTSVYVRLLSTLASFNGEVTTVTISYDTYLSREKRLQGASPLFAPHLEYRTTHQVPSSSAWGSMEGLYGLIKSRLVEQGFTVEDVLEPTLPLDVSGSTP